MAKVIVEIDKTGRTRMEGEGFQGKSCAAVIDRLAAALGANTDELNHEWKPEAVEVTGEQVAEG